MPILRDFLLRWIFHYRRLRLTNRVLFDFVAKLGFNRTALIFHGVFFGGLLRLRTRPFANVWRKSMCRLLGSGLPANSTAVIFMKFHEYPKQVSQPILICRDRSGQSLYKLLHLKGIRDRPDVISLKVDNETLEACTTLRDFHVFLILVVRLVFFWFGIPIAQQFPLIFHDKPHAPCRRARAAFWNAGPTVGAT